MPTFLTQKLGPLPVWTYALAGAALLALVALYRRGQSSLSSGSTPSSIAASPYASSSQGQLNYPPTVVVTPAGVTNTVSPAPTPATTPATTPAPSTIPDFPTWLRQAFTGARPDILAGVQQNKWSDVTGQYAREVAAAEASGRGGGEGEGDGGARATAQVRPVRAGTIYTRPATGSQRWDYYTPFQPQQFVDGRGGGIGHVSRATGIPAARLKALNYHLRRPGGHYGPGIIRIG